MSRRATATAVDVVLLASADPAPTLANLDRLDRPRAAPDGSGCEPTGRLVVVEQVDDAGPDGSAASSAGNGVATDQLQRGLRERVGSVGVVRVDTPRLDRSSAAAVVGATVGTMWAALLVQVPRRFGAAAATNVAMQVLRVAGPASYFWLMDGSVEAVPGMLAALMATCSRDRSIGLCAATEVTDGGLRPAGYQRARWSGRTGPLPTLAAGSIGAAEQARIESRLDAVDGSALFGTRRALYALGDLRVAHLAPFEDHDLAARTRRAGYRLGWAPEARFHRIGEAASIGGPGNDAYGEARGAVTLAALHRPAVLPFVLGARVAASARSAARGDLPGAQNGLQGAFDGLRHRPNAANTDHT